MKKNVGPIDRGMRIALGLALIGAGVYQRMWWVVIAGAVIAATGILGWCGLYAILGLNTCPAGKAEDKK